MVKFILKEKKGLETAAFTNYLDDFLFALLLQSLSNLMVQTFMEMCEKLGVPISLDKMEWASTRIIFLGILLDGTYLVLVVPEDKRIRALNQLQACFSGNKVRIQEIQSLAGLLNFLNKAIIPGRVFTHRMYAKFSNIIDGNGNKIVSGKFKPHHHIKVDKEFKLDCQVWIGFLNSQERQRTGICRPFIDFTKNVTSAQVLRFLYRHCKRRILRNGRNFQLQMVVCTVGTGLHKTVQPQH